MIKSLLCFLLFTTGLAEAQEKIPPMRVQQKIPLEMAETGMDGKLEILEDKRISAELRKAMWGVNTDPREVLDQSGKRYQAFSEVFSNSAAIRLTDTKGESLQTIDLTYPLAEIAKLKLKLDGRPVYAVTNDGTNPSPHYGKVTHFYTIQDNKLEPVIALNERTGQAEPIIVERSAFVFWELVQTKGKWLLRDITCSGGQGDNGGLKVTYTATRFDGQRALSRTRVKEHSGCPEGFNPSDFP